PTDNDRDADLDPLEVASVGAPESGIATLGDDLQVTYTATAEFVGTDRFTYTITDGRDGEATADIVVEVLPALSVTIVAPQAGDIVPAGTVSVVGEVVGCELGGTGPTGCRIVGSFDGAEFPSDDATVDIETTQNGATTVALELVAADGTALSPPVEDTVTFTTVGGTDPGEFVGDIAFGDAEAMTRFCEDGFTNVTGNVSIEVDFTVQTLDALTCLERVRGGLGIDQTGLLSAVLPNLIEVTAGIGIGDNALLTEVSFPALASTGLLRVVQNNALLRVQLTSLTDVGDRLELSQNTVLTTLDVPALHTVGGDVVVQSMLALSTLELPVATTIGGIVDVSSNSGILAIDAPLLEELGGLEAVFASLRTLDLPSLVTVDGDVELRFVDLATVSLPRLETIGGGLEFTDTETLTSFSAPALTTVGGTLRFFDTPQVGTIVAPQLATLGGFDLQRNDVLTSLSLPATDLETLVVESNLSLASLSLAALQQLGDGSVRLNGSLTSLDLGSLATVDDGLGITNNALTQLDLSALVTAGGRFDISRNGLTGLDLSNLQTVGWLRVTSEDLTTLSLPSLVTSTDRVELRDLAAMVTLSMPVLQDVTDLVQIINSSVLTAVFLPSLSSNTSVTVSGGPLMTVVSLPSLVEANVFLSALPALGGFDLSSFLRGGLSVRSTGLTTIDVTFDSLDFATIRENPALGSVVLRGSVLEDLDTSFNPVLTTLELDVTTAGDMLVFNNDTLATFDATSTALAGGNGRASISGNPQLVRLDFSALIDAPDH
ncbi:MAG: Ig-like domain-containing protein, partial [Myxococcota bacterium]